MNKLLINDINEIKTLKKNLMEIEQDNTTTAVTITTTKDELKNILDSAIHAEIGLIFEENVRETLINEYNFDESEFPRYVLSRKIENENKTKSETILSAFDKTISINGKELKFVMNSNSSISIYEGDKLIKIIKDKKYDVKKAINEELISFSHHEEIEVDGILVCDAKFKLKMFNENEVLLVFSNVKEKEEKEFKAMVLEVKLNADSCIEGIIQIKRDAKFFGKISNEKIIYILFVGSGIVDHKISFNELLSGIKCVIYSIKNDKLCGRNLRSRIDWITVREVKKTKKSIKEIKKSIKEINKKLDIILENHENK